MADAGPGELILYELSVNGFTEGDPDIGRRIAAGCRESPSASSAGYFDRLGVTALSIMPLAEFPTVQGPDTLGYNPSLYFTVERDFGSPDDLRALVDTAHRQGLAVILDQVFNHTDNGFNPLWKSIIEHPDEEADAAEGGLYFSGATPWGNRVATEKVDVQNMLIDACKLLIAEYHVDGFRFDATHTNYMDHGFVLRLAARAEGVQGRRDLWSRRTCRTSRISTARASTASPSGAIRSTTRSRRCCARACSRTPTSTTPIGSATIFFFSRDLFAAHTNNVVNYCESHDEHSVPLRGRSSTRSSTMPAAKERKARLGLLASSVRARPADDLHGARVQRRAAAQSRHRPMAARISTRTAISSGRTGCMRLRRRYPG